MTAEELVASFRERGIRLIANPPILSVEPASKLTDIDRTAIRQAKHELLQLLVPTKVIEATFRTASVPACRTVEFPPCPICGETRYWLSRGGLVRCGTKRCTSAARFQLISLEIQAVN